MPIETFLQTLTKQRNTSTLTNPYRDAAILNNLRIYLNHMCRIEGRRVLLVGEAPGYKGCRITGIPFSSGRIFTRAGHPLLDALRDELVFARIEAENTASIVWEYLCARCITPLFWNSLPFHPHPPGKHDGNRAPMVQEIAQGVSYLRDIERLFHPDQVAGVGAKGTECARRAFPERQIVCIRHPSFGGKAEFIRGMDRLFPQDMASAAG
ncbi:uracil-DNA glycosylase [Azomonas macrocytogenes]|uniref:Uracil-DNA glycosylase-like domain-containing protein n=1 Tax=Azomonas macrocytogenes TaxID=69962 RepID=A0A839T703_AZOMA|nr:uracil-DNA glycosylase [Azomonas macrocytogenes]MBB3104878.1 hypothetical protein [Azomonas macrocytogenes]